MAEEGKIQDKEVIENMEKVLKTIEEAMKNNQEETQVVEDKEKEYAEKIARQQAEFENYRKRTEKEKIEYKLNANASLISELLSVLDNFELALKHNKDKGVMMIYEELNKILEKQGVIVIDTKGQFNPKIHEAVIKVDGEQEGVILEEIQKGYMLNDKLLRASKVKVSKVKEQK